MKALILSLFLLLMPGSEPGWELSFQHAQQEAVQQKKCILLNFSGSDWCGPCMRLKREIFNSESFKTMAAQRLVLVNADFPRQKKNELGKEQTQRNEELADKYNPNGKFPLTLLLDASGKVKKTWDGYPNESPEKFVEELNKAIGAAN